MWQVATILESLFGDIWHLRVCMGIDSECDRKEQLWDWYYFQLQMWNGSLITESSIR